MKKQNSYKKLGIIILAPLWLISMGSSPLSCGSSDSSSTTTTGDNGSNNGNSGNSGNNGGSGGTFTAADLIGTWTTTCQTLTSGTASATHYQNTLTITSGGNWFFQQFTYTGSSCANNNEDSWWNSGGTFTVGGVTSGDIQSLQFTVSTLYNQVQTAAAAQWYYENSSNATPLYGNVPANFGAPSNFAGAAGYDYNFFNASVTGLFASDFDSSTYTTVNNVATYTSTTLTLGAGSETVPGVFSNQTTPTTPTISYASGH